MKQRILINVEQSNYPAALTGSPPTERIVQQNKIVVLFISGIFAVTADGRFSPTAGITHHASYADASLALVDRYSAAYPLQVTLCGPRPKRGM